MDLSATKFLPGRTGGVLASYGREKFLGLKRSLNDVSNWTCMFGTEIRTEGREQRVQKWPEHEIYVI